MGVQYIWFTFPQYWANACNLRLFECVSLNLGNKKRWEPFGMRQNESYLDTQFVLSDGFAREKKDNNSDTRLQHKQNQEEAENPRQNHLKQEI